MNKVMWNRTRCVMCGRMVLVKEEYGKYICTYCVESVPIEEEYVSDLNGVAKLANE